MEMEQTAFVLFAHNTSLNTDPRRIMLLIPTSVSSSSTQVGRRTTSSSRVTSRSSPLSATIVLLLSSFGVLRSQPVLRLTTCSALATSFGKSSSSSFRQHPSTPFLRQMASASSDTAAAVVHTPPTARREEDRVLYAGAPPPGWNPKHPRQAEDSEEALLDPPVAIPDPYGWMRDDTRKDEQVLEHFKLENDYTEAMTKHLTPLRDTLYQELLSSIQETDYTVPRPKQDYVYYSRTIEGQSYSIHCRAPRTETAAQDAQSTWDGSKESIVLPEEHVMLDVNALAQDKDYCSTGSITVSPSQKLLAYSVDFTGGETYKIYVKDLASNEQVDHDPELESYSSVVWGADDTVFFYMKMDDTHRPFQLYKHKVGTPATEDVLLKEEPDVTFWSGIGKSKDGKYLSLEHSSSETSESWFLDLEDPNATLQCIAKRRPKVLYEVEHRKGTWWISSNVGGTPNMQLLKAPAKADCAEEWTPVTDSSSGQPLFDGSFTRALSDVSVFDSHVVVQGREGGIPRVWVLSFADSEDDSQVSMERLEFEEPAHDVGLSSNREYETDKFAISYDSMVTPPATMEISFANLNDRTVLKSKKVPGYDKELYGCDRVMVQSRDGTTMIPVSMVYRKDVMEQHLSSGNPIHVHQYAYGAYGACIEADFRSSRLPLLNRGIVYVIAHVRGGGEMGRFWYEEPSGGKYLCKKNTFNDFVDVGRWLVDEKKLTIPDKLSCEGRSAGGLTLGASINQAPELYRMALFGVPFVDVVHTMTDASIPLTANEWEEWGNPNEVKFHSYMMEYSPTSNVKPGVLYPSCWLTGGINDPRVPFWEPGKLTALLRHAQSTANAPARPICLKTEMSAGHFSASDRYKYLRELAYDYAFLLDQVGLADQ